MLDLNDKKINGSAIKLNSADNVAVALSEIKAGTNLIGTNIKVKWTIFLIFTSGLVLRKKWEY